MSNQLLTVFDVAKKLQVSQVSVRRWISQGKISYIKVGRCTRFDSDEIDRWIEKRSIPAGGAR